MTDVIWNNMKSIYSLFSKILLLKSVAKNKIFLFQKQNLKKNNEGFLLEKIKRQGRLEKNNILSLSSGKISTIVLF